MSLILVASGEGHARDRGQIAGALARRRRHPVASTDHVEAHRQSPPPSEDQEGQPRAEAQPGPLTTEAAH
jgi:hypothetical protein